MNLLLNVIFPVSFYFIMWPQESSKNAYGTFIVQYLYWKAQLYKKTEFK